MTSLVNSVVDWVFPALGILIIVWVVAFASRPPEKAIKFENRGDLE